MDPKARSALLMAFAQGPAELKTVLERLPEGSLQCHWRLELTPAGVARARALIGP